MVPQAGSVNHGEIFAFSCLQVVGEGNTIFGHDLHNLGTILLPVLVVAWSKRALDLQVTAEADTQEDFL